MADTPNLAVVANDLQDRVKFITTLIHTGAATDDVFSQAIPTYGLQPEGAVIHMDCIGVTTRDVNLFVEGSMTLTGADFQSFLTRELWDDLSADAADVNLLSTAEIFLNAFVYESGNTTGVNVVPMVDPAFNCEYFRFRSNGETGNLVTSSTVVTILMKKRRGFGQISGGYRAFDTV